MRLSAVLLMLVVGCTDGEEPATDLCTDDGEQMLVFVDQDGDGWGGEPLYVHADADDPTFVDQGGDCNDLDAEISPDALEICDQIDNDCNGTADDNAGDDWFVDGDGDGLGAGEPIVSCDPVAGRVETGGDCDDGDDMLPAEEICDGIDTDCDDATAPDETATCPGEFFTSGSSVYFLVDTPSTFPNADTICGDVGYHLAFIESADEQAAIEGWLAGTTAWTGGVRGIDCPADEWSWFDGRDDSCTPFGTYEDGRGLGTVDSVAAFIDAAGSWQMGDALGSEQHAVLCEVEF